MGTSNLASLQPAIDSPSQSLPALCGGGGRFPTPAANILFNLLFMMDRQLLQHGDPMCQPVIATFMFDDALCLRNSLLLAPAKLSQPAYYQYVWK